MRKSAEKAGIPRDNLTIALEPEAASIYCQTFPSPDCQEIAETGSIFMVVDLGGGTVDITLHEKNPNGTLKEVVKASGNDCGGTSVDDEFIHMFVCIFGEPIMNSLKLEFPDSYLYLLRKIENVKRVYQISQTRNVNITIPRSTLDEISTPVPKGHTIEKMFGTHSTSGSRYHFYYTESTDVKYTDTGECSFLGGFDMHFSNPDRKKMKVTFNFGDTEFSVTVLDPESGSERKVFFENQR
ncbi:unnamed protein product [Mytilus coruscus]|uniref:Uncharacterized protein n=1 Tax=Mytilus coruscus TaxID=42192 RepID=A0A6J8D982_MYTCO|nr:unnamed protein product [Mytilus coruscus]